MPGRLVGKTALVIGAGSIGPGWGNGKATAVLFAREEAKVFCVDINADAARETAEIISSEGGEAEWWQADASNSEEVQRAVANCQDRYGSIDVLDNNVGIVEVGDVVDYTEQQWDRIMDINLKSCFLAMKYTIPVMELQGAGSIINISSITSIRHTGVPYIGYYTSKAAMNHLSSTTAVQFARKNIRVNAILPGLMKTPMVEAAVSGLASSYEATDVDGMWRTRDEQCPMGHMGDAWDVAYAALFLASDEAKYITGVILPVDGGITVRCA